jgi:hypothetical protein
MGHLQRRSTELVTITFFFFKQKCLESLSLLNNTNTDYYRVAYDTNNYGLIRDQLIADHQRVSANNRAQLLDDAFTLALTELISYAQALDLTLYLKYEREYVPWHAVLSELNYIDNMLYNFPDFSNWKVCQI